MSSGEIIMVLIGVVSSLITAYVALNQKNTSDQLRGLKEQGALRGQHLEDKIIDVKLYVKEIIDGVKEDFSSLKEDVGQRQMMDNAIKQEILKEMQQIRMELKEMEKDVSIMQDLYEKRIKHEGEVMDKIESISFDLDVVKRKSRKLDNEYKTIIRALRNNGINTDETD